MQVTAVVEAPAPFGENRGSGREPAKSGEFDLVLAAVNAFLNAGQGRIDPGGQTATPEGEDLILAGRSVLTGDREAAEPGEDMADGAQWLPAAGLPVTINAAALAADLTGAGILQEEPARAEGRAQGIQMMAENLAVIGRQDHNAVVQNEQAAIEIAETGESNASSGLVNLNEVLRLGQAATGEVDSGAAALKTETAGSLPQDGTGPVSIIEKPGVPATTSKKETVDAGGQEGPAVENIAEQGCETAETVVKTRIFKTTPPVQSPPSEKAENKIAGLDGDESVQEKITGRGPDKVEIFRPGTEQEPVFSRERAKYGGEPERSQASPETKNSHPGQAEHPQFDLTFKTQAAGNRLKAAEVPGFEEKLLQEIRHVLIAYRDRVEPQTLVKLKLDSEQLGQLTVRLFFSKGELNAHFYTENSFARNFIEGSLQQLRESLAQQDLRLNEALVFSTDGRGGGPGHQYGERGEQGLYQYGRCDYHFYSGTREEPLELPSNQAGHARVNYLI